MYFESDPRLSKEMILAFGKKLRSGYYRRLPDFADEIQLIDEKDFYESHADFLSRLAMTFSYGDYALIEEIYGKEDVAQRLYERSLLYYPNQRAYLGLGIIKQRQREYGDSVQILSEGVKQFPYSQQLVVCLGISYMNLGQYDNALECFLKFPSSQETLQYVAACYQALGDSEKEASVLRKLEMISDSK
jgi:tetratricopeptide (TPR) repeat protein